MNTAVAGIQLGVAQAGIKKADHEDLVLIALAPGTRTAALFTRNAFRAAPVQIAEAHLAAAVAQPRYLLINTGNANAGTGEAGIQAASECCEALARLTETDASAVLPFSTGVIGEPLSAELINAALPNTLDDLCDTGWERAAGAILTTDTRAKLRSVEIELDGQRCTITGIAKGAGMICPNMATMLAFVATDAAIDAALLDSLLKSAVSASFNRITVDGDTSTNDAVTLSATGQSGIEITAGSEHAEHFAQALTTLMIELAQDIVRDGEGASKFSRFALPGASLNRLVIRWRAR